MTLRQKIIELAQLRRKNKFTGDDGYPDILVSVPLRHDPCHGAVSYEVSINNGIPGVLTVSIPPVYRDILDQEVVSEETHDTWDDTLCVEISLPDAYLDAKSRELNDAIPPVSETLYAFERGAISAMETDGNYQSATDDEKQYVRSAVAETIENVRNSVSTPTDALTKTQLVLKYEREAIASYLDKYRRRDMTNAECIKSLCDDVYALAAFLVREMPPDVRGTQAIAMWLTEKRGLE